MSGSSVRPIATALEKKREMIDGLAIWVVPTLPTRIKSVNV